MWNWNSYDELYHHGILGMHWGKRNGPPYPLGVSDHSASERKAGWRKSLGGSRNPQDYAHKKGLSDKQKKILKGTVITAGTILAVYGVYKLSQTTNAQAIGKQYLKGVVNDISSNEVVKNVGNTAKDISQRIKPNPGECNFNSFAASMDSNFNIKLKSDAPYINNVSDFINKALKNPEDHSRAIGVKDVFKDKERLSNAILRFVKNEEGASGQIGCDLMIGGGHAFNYRVKDGKVEFFDVLSGVTGERKPLEDATIYFDKGLLDGGHGIITRLDNLNESDLNMDFLRTICDEITSRT